MTLRLLDSNVIMDLLNGVPEIDHLVRQLFESGDTICTCDVVIAEVLSGVYPQDRTVTQTFLERCRFLPSTPTIGELAGTWRFGYMRQGITLAIPDLLIAATAVEYDATLLTRNVRHFPMPELSTMLLN